MSGTALIDTGTLKVAFDQLDEWENMDELGSHEVWGSRDSLALIDRHKQPEAEVG